MSDDLDLAPIETRASGEQSADHLAQLAHEDVPALVREVRRARYERDQWRAATAAIVRAAGGRVSVPADVVRDVPSPAPGVAVSDVDGAWEFTA